MMNPRMIRSQLHKPLEDLHYDKEASKLFLNQTWNLEIFIEKESQVSKKTETSLLSFLDVFDSNEMWIDFENGTIVDQKRDLHT